MNLLSETKRALKKSGHKIADIIFIGSEESGHQCTWAKFKKIADIDYPHGYGAQKIATDLIIVFADGTKLWRNEYDGSEWWEYSKPFKTPEKKKPLTSLHARYTGWETLEEINK